jgi:anti-anti-sigma factor
MVALQVQTIESSQGVVVRLQGEAGYLDADTLHLPLLALLAQRPALVVFDMEQLAFVASVVMGALVRFRRSQIVHGGKVVLAALQPSVLESFQAARLLELFESADTVDQALSNAAS